MIAEYYYYRGLTNKKLMLFESARQDFQKGIEINPKLDYLYYNLGLLLYQDIEDYNGALLNIN